MKNVMNIYITGKRQHMLFAALLAVLFGTIACISGVPLRTEPMVSGVLPDGPYAMLLSGCSYSEKLDNAVILAPENGAYRFEVYGPAFEIKVRQGVSAADALQGADRFLRCSIYYQKSQARRVLDPAGAVIGYEVRPLYSPVKFGREDLLSISYRMDNGKALVYIWLDQDIERTMNSEGDGMKQDSGAGGY